MSKSSNSLTDVEVLRMRVKRRGTVIAILTLLLIIVFVLYLLSEAIPNNQASNIGMFIDPSDDPPATDNVESYRAWIRHPFQKVSKGLWFDSASIRGYLDTIYPRLVNRFMKMDTNHKIDTSKYKWVIGFYWMRKTDNDDNKRKHDFYVVPTLVNKNNPKDVLDYFDSNVRQYFHPSPTDRPASTGGNAYNAGQLWP